MPARRPDLARPKGADVRKSVDDRAGECLDYAARALREELLLSDHTWSAMSFFASEYNTINTSKLKVAIGLRERASTLSKQVAKLNALLAQGDEGFAHIMASDYEVVREVGATHAKVLEALANLPGFGAASHVKTDADEALALHSKCVSQILDTLKQDVSKALECLEPRSLGLDDGLSWCSGLVDKAQWTDVVAT